MTEGKVLMALTDAGYQILLPFGSGCRYDLAFDDHGTIKRVQCKTGQLLKNRGAVFFRTAKQYPNGRFVPYTNDADYFGVSTAPRRMRFTSCRFPMCPRAARTSGLTRQ